MKKIISLVLAFAMVFSLCVVPASAENSSVAHGSFWDMLFIKGATLTENVPFVSYIVSSVGSLVSSEVCNVSSDHLHHGDIDAITGAGRDSYTVSCTCDYCGDTFTKTISSSDVDTLYDNYVSTVNTTLGTSVVGDNCIYLGNWSYNESLSTPSVSAGSTFSSGPTYEISGICPSSISSGNYGYSYVETSFTAPVSGVYTFTYFYSLSTSSTNSSAKCAISWVKLYSGSSTSEMIAINGVSASASCSGSLTSTTATLVSGTTYTFRCQNFVCGVGSDYPFVINGACRIEYPTDGLTTAAGDVDVSSGTRTGAITGDFVSVNGDVYNDCTIFNETTNTYTDPSTGTTMSISSWTYDYATRTYSLYDANGNLITVAYQDQQLVITSGGTTTNYSYATDSSGGSSGDSGSTGTVGGVFGALINFLSSINGVISSAVSSVGSVVSSLITTVGNIFTGIFGLFNNLNTFIFGDGTTQSATDFYNSPSTFSGGSVWG